MLCVDRENVAVGRFGLGCGLVDYKGVGLMKCGGLGGVVVGRRNSGGTSCCDLVTVIRSPVFGGVMTSGNVGIGASKERTCGTLLRTETVGLHGVSSVTSITRGRRHNLFDAVGTESATVACVTSVVGGLDFGFLCGNTPLGFGRVGGHAGRAIVGTKLGHTGGLTKDSRAEGGRLGDFVGGPGPTVGVGNLNTFLHGCNSTGSFGCKTLLHSLAGARFGRTLFGGGGITGLVGQSRLCRAASCRRLNNCLSRASARNSRGDVSSNVSLVARL